MLRLPREFHSHREVDCVQARVCTRPRAHASEPVAAAIVSAWSGFSRAAGVHLELREHDSSTIFPAIFSGHLLHCQLTASCDESGQL